MSTTGLVTESQDTGGMRPTKTPVSGTNNQFNIRLGTRLRVACSRCLVSKLGDKAKRERGLGQVS